MYVKSKENCQYVHYYFRLMPILKKAWSDSDKMPYNMVSRPIYEPRFEKTGLRCFRPAQTGLSSDRRWLEVWNFRFRKESDCINCVAKKALISCALPHTSSAPLFCFVLHMQKSGFLMTWLILFVYIFIFLRIVIRPYPFQSFHSIFRIDIQCFKNILALPVLSNLS